MSHRERGSIWPIVSVAAGAFFVLVIVPLILGRQRSEEMATVDAQVNIGDAGSAAATARNASVYRWPDSEVPRTAERLRDVTAVAIAATSAMMEGAMHGRLPRDTGEILKHIVERQLIPAEWLTQRDSPSLLTKRVEYRNSFGAAGTPGWTRAPYSSARLGEYSSGCALFRIDAARWNCLSRTICAHRHDHRHGLAASPLQANSAAKRPAGTIGTVGQGHQPEITLTSSMNHELSREPGKDRCRLFHSASRG
jgi:hypothetical protein